MNKQPRRKQTRTPEQKEKRKQYNKMNPEITQLSSKKYYLENKEKINNYNKNYNKENADELKIKRKIANQKRYMCECGCEVIYKHKLRHNQTNKHKKAIALLF